MRQRVGAAERFDEGKDTVGPGGNKLAPEPVKIERGRDDFDGVAEPPQRLGDGSSLDEHVFFVLGGVLVDGLVEDGDSHAWFLILPRAGKRRFSRGRTECVPLAATAWRNGIHAVYCKGGLHPVRGGVANRPHDSC